MNANLMQVSSVLTMVLVIFAIIVVLFIVVFMFTKRYDDEKRQSDAARDAIRELRKKRLELINQALQMFSNDNPHAKGLSKLAELYGSIDSEKKEIAWEQKYVLVMKKFMAYAKRELPANMESAWKMSNIAINENEEMLDSAREAYVSCQQALASYRKPPQSYMISIGNRIMGAMRSHASEQAAANAEKSAIEAGVMAPEDAVASRPVAQKAKDHMRNAMTQIKGAAQAAQAKGAQIRQQQAQQAATSRQQAQMQTQQMPAAQYVPQIQDNSQAEPIMLPIEETIEEEQFILVPIDEDNVTR